MGIYTAHSDDFLTRTRSPDAYQRNFARNSHTNTKFVIQVGSIFAKMEILGCVIAYHIFLFFCGCQGGCFQMIYHVWLPWVGFTCALKPTHDTFSGDFPVWLPGLGYFQVISLCGCHGWAIFR